ncbi:MAG: winged helix-turn-helix domain-containing protein [Candidatus Bathyarchaeota archaeon]|jgi:predicted transcriptional regulator
MTPRATPVKNEDTRRNRTEIIAAILTLSKQGESPTRIAEKARLNSKQLRIYLEELVQLGLIELNKINGKHFFITTQRGDHYLNQQGRLDELLRR